MSARAARIRVEMKPLNDEYQELEVLPAPTEKELARKAELKTILRAMVDDHKKAVQDHEEAIELKRQYESMEEGELQPRARYDGSSQGQQAHEAIEGKSWFDVLTERKTFQRAVRDNAPIRESIPIQTLYPFFEKKTTPFQVTNPALLSGPMDIFNQATTRNRHPVLDLIPTVEDNRYAIPYLPLTFVNAALETAWGAAKPVSENTGTIQTINQRTIAHLKHVIRQQLHYLPGLRGEIEAEMREGVLARLEFAVIQGTGVAPLISGLLTQATLAAAGADLVLQIMDAIATVESNGGIVDAILVNPKDYQKLLVYEWSANTFNSAATGGGFFGYRIVKSSTMPEGKAIVADWAMAAKLYIGEALRVDATEAAGTNFSTNVVSFRGEMDAVVLLARPWLLVECTAAMPEPPPLA